MEYSQGGFFLFHLCMCYLILMLFFVCIMQIKNKNVISSFEQVQLEHLIFNGFGALQIILAPNKPYMYVNIKNIFARIQKINLYLPSW